MIGKIKYIPYLVKEHLTINQFESWPQEKIRNYQVRAFQKIFERAKQIPFYRDLYKEAGVFDSKIKSLEDLEQLPVIDKAMCRERGYEDYFVHRHLPKSIITPTSGSTGHPFQIRTHEKLELASPVRVIYIMRQFGWKPLDKGLEIWVEEKKTHKKLMRRFGLLKSISIFEPPEKIRDILEKEKPAYLFSNRTTIEVLIDHMQRDGFDYRPKYIMCSAGEVYAHQREKIESFFHAKLINVYGCLEAPTMAYSCPECDQFHVFQTTAIAEVLNKHPIEGEECGDLVVTNLANDLMPFIRYKTGDVVKIIPEKCNCKRNSQVIGEIMGRADEVIKLSDGRSFNYLHFWMRLKKPLLIDYIDKIEQYKIWFFKKDEDLLFQFRLNDKVSKKEGNTIINHLMKENFPDIKARYEIVDEIPISKSGKFKIIEVVEG